MRLRRLGWAGIEIEHEDQVLVIDLLENGIFSPDLALEGPLPAPSRPGRTNAALITHLHFDHTDPAALRRALAPGAPLYRPEPEINLAGEESLSSAVELTLRDSGLNAEPVAVWDSRTVGPFRVTACPAVDGLGDLQISWVVDTGDLRIFHGGDTMFHGYWWLIAQRLGPIDIAVLPINGPVLADVPKLHPSSPLPSVLLPEQAAVAAHLLGASIAVPMHYGLDRPPLYAQTPDAVGRFERSVRELGIRPAVLSPGEYLVR